MGELEVAFKAVVKLVGWVVVLYMLGMLAWNIGSFILFVATR